MTREIKFRAFVDDRMIYSKSTEDNDEFLIFDNGQWNHDVEGNSGSSWVVDNEFIMQYTGLKDKNGVEIYENDIVEMDNPHYLSSNSKVRYIIEFQDEVDNPNDYPNTISGYLIGRNPVVIGNIYENSELIK